MVFLIHAELRCTVNHTSIQVSIRQYNIDALYKQFFNRLWNDKVPEVEGNVPLVCLEASQYGGTDNSHYLVQQKDYHL